MMKLLILLSAINICCGFRILGFFPFFASSHHQTFAPVMYELAKRGHQVVYLTAVPTRFTHPNLEVREIENYRKKYLDELDLLALGAAIIPQATRMFARTALKLSDDFYGKPEAQKIIHGNETFDAVLMESHFNQEPVSALIHKFGCVGIELASMGDIAWLNELSGIPDNSAYQMDFKTVFSDRMSLWERVHNWYATWSTILVSYYNLWEMQSVMDQYFNYTGWESRPSIFKLVSNKSMILVNRDVVLNFPFPQAPHVKNIGGINLLPNKPLPKNIQDYMDNAHSGVIYFSFGSNLNTSDFMAGDTGKAFLDVMKTIPQKVIMKWENDDAQGLPPNVMAKKWLPQQDILAHNNCVLFITHCGYNSLMESVYHSVPVIGIPVFGDQFKNAEFLATSGIGLQLHLNNITPTSVSWVINELIKNPRYKKEVSKRASMLREKNSTAAERAVEWVEFAIKYPNVLTPKSAFLSFFELHMLDVTFVVFASIFVFYKLLSILFLFFTRSITLKEKLTSRGPVRKVKRS